MAAFSDDAAHVTFHQRRPNCGGLLRRRDAHDSGSRRPFTRRGAHGSRDSAAGPMQSGARALRLCRGRFPPGVGVDSGPERWTAGRERFRRNKKDVDCAGALCQGNDIFL